jgi:hypothetical protein
VNKHHDLSRDGLLSSGGADDAAMGWQAMDARDYWDGLTNGSVVAPAAGEICPMAWMLLADGTDASPDTGEWAARGQAVAEAIRPTALVAREHRVHGAERTAWPGLAGQPVSR